MITNIYKINYNNIKIGGMYFDKKNNLIRTYNGNKEDILVNSNYFINICENLEILMGFIVKYLENKDDGNKFNIFVKILNYSHEICRCIKIKEKIFEKEFCDFFFII